MKKILLPLLLAAVFMFGAVSCAKGNDSTSRSLAESGEQQESLPGGEAPESPQEGDSSASAGASSAPVRERVQLVSNERQLKKPLAGDIVVSIETDKGTIKALLFEKEAPLACENFTSLAASGYYNGSEFFRVERDFIIQGGDPENNGSGGMSIWGEPFGIEISNKLKHYSGALCMAAGSPANGEEGSIRLNGSQFYIVQTYPGSVDENMLNKLKEAGESTGVIEGYKQAGGAPYLDNTDSVFGQVFEGMEIVDQIAAGSLKEDGSPKRPVKIISIQVEIAQ